MHIVLSYYTSLLLHKSYFIKTNSLAMSSCYNKDEIHSGCFHVLWLWAAFVLLCAPERDYVFRLDQ